MFVRVLPKQGKNLTVGSNCPTRTLNWGRIVPNKPLYKRPGMGSTWGQHRPTHLLVVAISESEDAWRRFRQEKHVWGFLRYQKYRIDQTDQTYWQHLGLRVTKNLSEASPVAKHSFHTGSTSPDFTIRESRFEMSSNRNSMSSNDPPNRQAWA